MGRDMPEPNLRMSRHATWALGIALLAICSACETRIGIQGSVVDAVTREPLGAVTVRFIAKYEDGRELPLFARIVDDGVLSFSLAQPPDAPTGFAGYDAIVERRGYQPVRLLMGATPADASAFSTRDTVVEMRREVTP